MRHLTPYLPEDDSESNCCPSDEERQEQQAYAPPTPSQRLPWGLEECTHKNHSSVIASRSRVSHSELGYQVTALQQADR
jgi:hypothetical protein